MKYYSEVLNCNFDTVESLVEEEAKHEAKLAEIRQQQENERLRKQALAEAKGARKQEVDAAFDKAYDLQAKYVQDYGAYCFYKSNIFWPFTK